MTPNQEYQQGNKIAGNSMNNMGGNMSNNNINSIGMNKNQNEFINQEMLINPKFIPNQNNFFQLAYNMNGINNMGNNRTNMNNLNNMNSINNINNINSGNYPPPIIQYSQSPIPMQSTMPNINNMNNLSFNNFNPHIYENAKYNQNPMQQNFGFSMPQDDNSMNNKKKKNNINKSPLEPGNNIPNLGNGMMKLNYPGNKNNLMKNQSNIPIKMNNNNISLIHMRSSHIRVHIKVLTI